MFLRLCTIRSETRVTDTRDYECDKLFVQKDHKTRIRAGDGHSSRCTDHREDHGKRNWGIDGGAAFSRHWATTDSLRPPLGPSPQFLSRLGPNAKSFIAIQKCQCILGIIYSAEYRQALSRYFKAVDFFFTCSLISMTKA